VRRLIDIVGRIGFISIAMSLAIFVSIPLKFSGPRGGGVGGPLNPNQALTFPEFGPWRLAADESLLVELEVSGSEATVYVVNGTFPRERPFIERKDFEELIEEGKIQVLQKWNVIGSAQLEYSPADTPVSAMLFIINEGRIPLELREYQLSTTYFLLPTGRATAASQLMLLAGIVMSAPRITTTVLRMFAKRAIDR